MWWWSRLDDDLDQVMIQMRWWSRSSDDLDLMMIQWWWSSSDDPDPAAMIQIHSSDDDLDLVMMIQWRCCRSSMIQWQCSRLSMIQWRCSRSSDDPYPNERWLEDEEDLKMQMTRWSSWYREEDQWWKFCRENTFLVKRECWCNCNFGMYFTCISYLL